MVKQLDFGSSAQSALQAEVARLKKLVRKQEREYQALLKNSKISEEIADNSKTRLLRAQAGLEAEIVERKRVEREFYRVIQEAEEAIALKGLFVEQLSAGLALPIQAAKRSLSLLGNGLESAELLELRDLVALQLDMIAGVLERMRASASHHSKKEEELSVAIHMLMRAAETVLQVDGSSDAVRMGVASEIRRGAAAILDADEKERKD